MNNLHRCFHFTYGDFGYYAEPEYGDIEWDKDGDEPTEEEVEEAYNHWQNHGWNEALQEYAEGLAEYRYESLCEDR